MAQLVLHAQQLLGLALQEAARGDAGPGAHHVRDVVGADLVLDHRPLGRLGLGLRGLRQLALQGGDLPVEQLGGGVEVPVALRALRLSVQVVHALLELADPVEGLLLLLPAGGQAPQVLLLVGEVLADLLQALQRGRVGLVLQRQLLHAQAVDRALELVDLQRGGVDLHAQPGHGLVDEVDGLVGEEAGGDVAVGEGRGGHESAVVDDHLVVGLVAALEPAQDRDGVLDGRLGDQHLLEAPLQRRVLLDPLAVLVEGGRADHAQLAAGQHGLEHVARVHGGVPPAARADDRVQLVDEGDDLAVARLDLGEHGLEPLLELTAVLGAGDHGAEVQGDEALVLEGLGDVALDDALGQALDDGRLADAGLADEHRVVLRAAREDLDDAPDLVVAADDGVELALARGRREIGAELLQGLVLTLGVGAGHPPSSSCVLECGEQLLRGRALGGEDLTGRAALDRDGDEQVFGGEVFVAEPAGLGVGLGEYGEQVAGGLRGRDRGAGDAGQGREQPLRAAAHGGLVGVGGDQQVDDVLVVLAA